MIYGLNFGAPDIPQEVRKLHRQRVKPLISQGNHTIYYLVGACNTQAESDTMKIVADNGHRKMECIQKDNWIGFYIN